MEKSIKQILDEIGSEPSSNAKKDILESYIDNKLLKRVLYLAYSKRIKFYIRQISNYTPAPNSEITLNEALDKLNALSKRIITGHDAIDYLYKILSDLDGNDAYVIERIIDKDLKIGINLKTINKIFKKLIEKTPYMGAIPHNEKKARKLFENDEFSSFKKYAFSDVKMDGRYCNAIIRFDGVSMESRSGEPTVLDGCLFVDELGRITDEYVLNGELTMDGVHRYESNGIISSLIDILKKSDGRTLEETNKHIANFEKRNNVLFDDALMRIRYTVWDMITVDEYFDNASKRPYKQRREKLIEIIEKYGFDMISLVESKIVFSYEEAIQHFQEMLERGEEGTILKSPEGTWKDGKPDWQIKMKLEITLDLEIIAFNYGTKGTKNEHLISSLTCKTSDGLLITSPGGISEDDMKYITKNQDKLMGAIIECKCSGLSQDNNGNWSTLHPVFNFIRDDKNKADSLEDAKKIEAMAKGLV